MEPHQKGLHVEDESGRAMWLQGVEAGLEQSRDQPLKAAEITATITMVVMFRFVNLTGQTPSRWWMHSCWGKCRLYVEKSPIKRNRKSGCGRRPHSINLLSCLVRCLLLGNVDDWRITRTKILRADPGINA